MNCRTASGRRRLRVFFIILIFISLLIFAGLLAEHLYAHISEKELQDTVAIIGGADGPTAIFVTDRNFSLRTAIIGAVLLAVSVIGFIMTRRK